MPPAVGPAWRLHVGHILFAFMVLATPARTQSVVFTCDQWEQLSAGLHEIYVSGAIDAVSTITAPAQASTSKYYNDCLAAI